MLFLASSFLLRRVSCWGCLAIQRWRQTAAAIAWTLLQQQQQQLRPQQAFCMWERHQTRQLWSHVSHVFATSAFLPSTEMCISCLSSKTQVKQAQTLMWITGSFFQIFKMCTVWEISMLWHHKGYDTSPRLVNNPARLFHCCPGWKIKIWNVYSMGPLKLKLKFVDLSSDSKIFLLNFKAAGVFSKFIEWIIRDPSTSREECWERDSGGWRPLQWVTE